MRGWEDLYGRPPGGWDRVPPSWEPGELDAGDHKGPPHRPSSALAPTECDEFFLRLMPMGVTLAVTVANDTVACVALKTSP